MPLRFSRDTRNSFHSFHCLPWRFSRNERKPQSDGTVCEMFKIQRSSAPKVVCVYRVVYLEQSLVNSKNIVSKRFSLSWIKDF